MKVKHIPHIDLEQELADGLIMRSGPFWYRISSRLHQITRHIATMYSDCTVEPHRPFTDYAITITRKRSLSAIIKPQAQCTANGQLPLPPLSIDGTPILLERTMSWCVQNFAHQYLLVNATVVEKNSQAIVIATSANSDKSTLCAALLKHDWRLLSDQLALITTDGSNRIIPCPRPIALKNTAIDSIGSYWPDAVISPPVQGLTNDTIAYLCPPSSGTTHCEAPARAAVIVVPEFKSGKDTLCRPGDKSAAWLALVEQAFNYHILGALGFHTLSQLLRHTELFNLRYRNLDHAVAHFEDWVS